MSKKCEKCKGKQVLDGKPCPALSVTVLGRLACELPDGTFDNKAEHRSILNARMQKEKAYNERDRVVALAAKLAKDLGYKVGKKRTPVPGWNSAWFGAIYIDLPTGQVSWHYHEREEGNFQALPEYDGVWDNHTTPEKYRRVFLHVTGKEEPKKQEEVEA